MQYFHVNFNDFSKILADHKGDIIAETIPGYCTTAGNCSGTGDLLGESGFVSLVRTDAGYAKGVSVRSLMGRYSLTGLSTYQHQSRHAINMQRMTAAPNVAAWKYNRNGHPNPNTVPQAQQEQEQEQGAGEATLASRWHAAKAQERDLRKLAVVAPEGGWSTEPERSVLVGSQEFVRAWGSQAGMLGNGVMG